MKVTKQQLEKIILEELESQVEEGIGDFLKRGVQKLKQTFKPKEPAAGEPAPAGEPAADGEQEVTPDQVVSQEPAAGEPAAGEPAAAEPAAAEPAAAEPAAAASKVEQAMQQAKTASSDIVLPQANLLSKQLLKIIGPAMAGALGALSQQQRGAVMTPVMNYLKSLPGISNPVLAEAMTPQDKQNLLAKHGANPVMVSKNLSSLKDKLLNQLKGVFRPDNVYVLLANSIPKQQQNSKEGEQYMKSVGDRPQAHLDVLLQNAALVLDNVFAIASAGIPEKAPVQQKPLPEDMDSLQETRRWQKLAGILKD